MPPKKPGLKSIAAGAGMGAGGDAKAKYGTGGRGGGGDDKDSSEENSEVQPARPHKERKRKDGTKNKMSFDVDELEEGLYIQVEDEDDVETVVEYIEVDDDSPIQAEGGEGEKETEKKYGMDMKPSEEDAGGYKIRPDLSQKFRPGTVQVLIENVIKEKLEGKEYNAEESEELTRVIMEDVHEKVKSQNYRRYKIISQITLGERRGEGAASATRCLWDAEADCMATYTFLNDSIFCNGTVYGIYFY